MRADCKEGRLDNPVTEDRKEYADVYKIFSQS